MKSVPELSGRDEGWLLGTFASIWAVIDPDQDGKRRDCLPVEGARKRLSGDCCLVLLLLLLLLPLLLLGLDGWLFVYFCVCLMCTFFWCRPSFLPFFLPPSIPRFIRSTLSFLLRFISFRDIDRSFSRLAFEFPAASTHPCCS